MSIAEDLKKIQSIADELNPLTDRAKEVIECVERALNESSIGISAGVEYESESFGETAELGYQRHGDRYRIVVGFPFEDGDRRYCPWVEMGRRAKLDSFQMLPQLLAEIIRLSDTAAESARQVPAIADEVMSAMSKATA